MRSVLISIQPKWCELIASGKKTVEVRKTKPKLETPFKVYIYCTKDNSFAEKTLRGFDDNGKPIYYKANKGKVIGEFVCDEIKEITADNLVAIYFNNPQESTCLNDLEMRKYADGKNLFLWHISDLVIYDKPKELREFYTVDDEAVQKCENRFQTYYNFTGTGYIKNGFACDYKDEWCSKCKTKPITRPPQSWCYVEERGE